RHRGSRSSSLRDAVGTLIRKFLYSACRFPLLVNRVHPCVHKPNGAARIDYCRLRLRPHHTPLCSACRFPLLVNRVHPCVHKSNGAARIDYGRLRLRPHHTPLCSACRFRLLANRVHPCARMPSADRDNLARSSELAAPRERVLLLQKQLTPSVSC